MMLAITPKSIEALMTLSPVKIFFGISYFLSEDFPSPPDKSLQNTPKYKETARPTALAIYSLVVKDLFIHRLTTILAPMAISGRIAASLGSPVFQLIVL